MSRPPTAACMAGGSANVVSVVLFGPTGWAREAAAGAAAPPAPSIAPAAGFAHVHARAEDI